MTGYTDEEMNAMFEEFISKPTSRTVAEYLAMQESENKKKKEINQ